MDMDQPVVGAVTSQLILTCSQLPMASNTTMKIIKTWPTTRQIFLPMTGSCPTTMSMPRWPCSRSATRAPRKVPQMKSQRETSSDTVMPELKP